MAAGSGAAEAEHRAEAREQQHLVELMTEIGAARAGQNLVGGHLAVGIDGDVEQQTMRQREFGLVLFLRPGSRKIGKRDEFGGLQDVERHIVLHGANGDAGHHELQHHDENQDGGDEAAGCRNGERTEHVFEQ